MKLWISKPSETATVKVIFRKGGQKDKLLFIRVLTPGSANAIIPPFTAEIGKGEGSIVVKSDRKVIVEL